MTILIFLIILSLLIFVHELGHFLFAKKAGVRVEEFGFGYPPRAFKIGRKWETDFTINWIPFGGFVKILGENYEDSEEKNTAQKVLGSPEQAPARLFSQHFSLRSKKFTEVSKKWQASILLAGVTFNIIFAWLLFTLGFIIGVPAPVENDFGGVVKNPENTVIGVLPDSPAFSAGLKSGDKIKSVAVGNIEKKSPTPEDVSSLTNDISHNQKVILVVDRGGEILDFSIEPKSGLVEDRKVMGINMEMVGTLKLSLINAFWQGAKTTFSMTYMTALGLFDLIKDSIFGKADLSQVTGPVGIVGLVGDASRLGFSYLITFTALISINLAIVNLIPFPALDGGRFLFVLIESMTGKPINPKIAGILNTVGFFILVTLMFIVTYRDILKIL